MKANFLLYLFNLNAEVRMKVNLEISAKFNINFLESLLYYSFWFYYFVIISFININIPKSLITPSYDQFVHGNNDQ